MSSSGLTARYRVNRGPVRLLTEQFDRCAGRGRCDFVAESAKPFSLLAIADLLGVREEDRSIRRDRIVATGPAGSLGEPPPLNLLGYLEEFFIPYIEERR